MKIEILKENLKSGLDIVEKVISKNLSLPVLNNVLISTEDSFLNLVSTNLETTVKFWVLSKIIKGGKVVIPIKIFSSFISSLPNDKITIEAKGQNLHIECRNFKTQIQGYNPEDFPIIPEFKRISRVDIDNQKFCQGFSQVIDIPVDSQARPEISGIYFNFLKNNLKLVATDSFRLAEKNMTIDGSITKESYFIFPQKPARDVLSILDGRSGLVGVEFSNNQVLFDFPMKETKRSQIQFISRLIEGEYPNYQEIIPDKFKTSVVLQKDEFLSQIKTVSLFSGRINEVKISIDPIKNEVEIFSKSPDLGESKSSIQAKVKGDPIEISFNYKYLTDGLLNIKSSEIVFEISKEEGACVLRPVGDTSYIYVLMPIKSL